MREQRQLAVTHDQRVDIYVFCDRCKAEAPMEINTGPHNRDRATANLIGWTFLDRHEYLTYGQDSRGGSWEVNHTIKHLCDACTKVVEVFLERGTL